MSPGVLLLPLAGAVLAVMCGYVVWASRRARRDLAAVHEALAEQAQRLDRETAMRARLQAQLQETEQRYALAIAGANDGMWEWSPRTGAAFFSPRWKSMLGCLEDDVGERIEEWSSRIHPDDAPVVLQQLAAHVDGRTEHFEIEHRLRHRDGEYRWVLARAAAVRRAGGAPERVVGLITDITGRRRAQEALLEVADGLAELSGTAAYSLLVAKFAQLLGVREAFLCECADQPPTRVRMLAYWYGGALRACEDFDLAGTPCERVIVDRRLLFVPEGVGEQWPEERMYGTEAYLGLPCVDSQGTIIGHIACKNDRAMRDELPHQAVLKLFAVRASVEIERQLIERSRGRLPARGESAQGEPA